MPRRHITTLVAIALLFALAGCGNDTTTTSSVPGGTATGDAQAVSITAKDNLFDPAAYTAEIGKPIKLTVTNSGQNIHEVEVKGLFPETKLSPGQTKTIDVQAPAAGTYKLYCEIHEDEGMEGEFVVK